MEDKISRFTATNPVLNDSMVLEYSLFNGNYNLIISNGGDYSEFNLNKDGINRLIEFLTMVGMPESTDTIPDAEYVDVEIDPAV